MNDDAHAAQRCADLLRQWRRMNGVKQLGLAQQLGVSQSTIAKWESGMDLPSPARQRQIRDLIAGTMRDELLISRLAITRQSGIRALVDTDGMKFKAISAGYCEVWPEFTAKLDQNLADHLINEAQEIVHNGSLYGDIMRGDVAMLSGVSLRHFNVPIFGEVKHRWDMSFRRYGSRIYVDTVMEICAPDLEPGIVERIYLDDLTKF